MELVQFCDFRLVAAQKIYLRAIATKNVFFYMKLAAVHKTPAAQFYKAYVVALCVQANFPLRCKKLYVFVKYVTSSVIAVTETKGREREKSSRIENRIGCEKSWIT